MKTRQAWRKAAHLHLCEPGTVVLHAVRDPRAAIQELAAEIGAFIGRPTQVVDALPDFKVEEDHTWMPAGTLRDDVMGLAAHFGYPVAVENSAD